MTCHNHNTIITKFKLNWIRTREIQLSTSLQWPSPSPESKNLKEGYHSWCNVWQILAKYSSWHKKTTKNLVLCESKTWPGSSARQSCSTGLLLQLHNSYETFYLFYFTTVSFHWDFSCGKFRLFYLGKASCDRVMPANILCMLRVLMSA